MFEKGERRIWSGGVESHKNKWEGIKSKSSFSVRKKRRIKFWKDLWCEDLPLEEAFPNYSLLLLTKIDMGRGSAGAG